MPSVKGMNGSGLVEAIEIGLVSADVKEWMIVAHKDAAGVSTEAEFGVVVKIVQVDWHEDMFGYWVERFGFNNSSAITCLFKLRFLHGCKKNMSITVLKALHHRLCKLEGKHLGMNIDDSSDDDDEDVVWYSYPEEAHVDSDNLIYMTKLLRAVGEDVIKAWLFLSPGNREHSFNETINNRTHRVHMKRTQELLDGLLTISCPTLSPDFVLRVFGRHQQIVRIEALKFNGDNGRTPWCYGFSGTFAGSNFYWGIVQHEANQV